MSRHPFRLAAGVGLLATALVAAPIATSDASRQAATAPADVATAVQSAAPSTGSPDHVVFIVLDQLRPEFIDAFNMKNVKRLMAGGTNFPNAYLGHMGSETVVSHNVMTSGLLPKHMGWADEWYRDTDNVLGVGTTVVRHGVDVIDAVRHADHPRRLQEAPGLPARRSSRARSSRPSGRRTTRCTR